jgi:UDP-4-amino-4-deoxy-L-arabinose-oxoglutarate aminotransferase
MKVEFFRHNIDAEDIDRTVGVLQSIFLTTGSHVAGFEKDLASYLNLPHAIGTTSCTAALHLCLLAWGIGPGDEVITTPMSFCATSNAVIHAGATPVFVDAEEETGNINAELIEARITEKTKAVLPVHLYGQLCDMKKIRQIADKHDLVIIEDAAHCIEGARDGFKVGELGDAACFSFYATKNITSGEGGAVSVHRKEKDDLLRMLRSHGIDRTAADRYTKKYQHWDMPVLGWKYNMDNIQAALLIGQLKRIDTLWERRDLLAGKYEEAFCSVPGIKLMKTAPDSRHARHLFTIQVAEKKRDVLLLALQERGIGVAVNYRAIHLLRYYRENFGFKEGDFPVAESIGGSTLSLPLYPLLRDEEADYVIKCVKDALGNGH